MSRALAILMESHPEVCITLYWHLDFAMKPHPTFDPQFQPPVHEAHFLYLLIICNMLIDNRGENLDLLYCGNIAVSFLSQF